MELSRLNQEGINNIQYALELKNVRKKFAGFELKGVSFGLPKGFIMGFVGENGAGKTTTIKLILNMLKADSGEIKIFGQDNLKNEIDIKEKIGVVMDSPFYVDNWTLAEVGKALRPFYKNWDTEVYNRYLTEFSLEQKKKVGDLSRGMKMKLMIACALSHGAELLILDEPTSGLDAVARNELLEILTRFIRNENNSVLLSTHISADLEKIADYITFISNGEILISETKDEVFEKYFVIRGSLGILSTEQKELIIGYQEYKTNFEGIIDKVNIKKFTKDVVIEPCNFDELVVRFNRYFACDKTDKTTFIETDKATLKEELSK